MASLNESQVTALRAALDDLRNGSTGNFVFPRDDLVVPVAGGSISVQQLDALETALNSLEGGVDDNEITTNLVIPRPSVSIDQGFEILRGISGRLTDENGDPISNARVTFIGNAPFLGSNFATTTDTNGNYNMNVLPHGWSGAVFPSDIGREFTPAEVGYDNVTSSLAGQNYVSGASVLRVLSGRVQDSALNPLPGALVTAVGGEDRSPGQDFTDTTDTNGDYSFNVNNGWGGTVTPSLTNYTFDPASKTYTAITADKTGENYESTFVARFTVGGTVLKSGIGLAGVNIQLNRTSGPSESYNATTNSSGVWSITNVIANWAGTIHPSLTGHTFTPTSLSAGPVLTNELGKDFTATSTVTYTISGTVAESFSPTVNPVAGIVVQFTGLVGSASENEDYNPITNASGFYTQTVTDGWSGRVKPISGSFTFSPTSFDYAGVTSNQTKNFTSTSSDVFPITGMEYIVDTNAAGGGDGSPGSPFNNIDDAMAVVVAGDGISLRSNGVSKIYNRNGDTDIQMVASGAAGSPIRIQTYATDIAGSGKAIIAPGGGGGGSSIFNLGDARFTHYYWKNLIFRDGREGIHFNAGGDRTPASPASANARMQHFRVEGCDFDTHWRNAALDGKNKGVEYLVVKDCTFSGGTTQDGTVQLKTSDDSTTLGSGSIFCIFDNCTSTNRYENGHPNATAPFGHSGSAGFIYQNNCENIMTIDCTTWQGGEIGFASKSGGYNIYIGCLAYGRARDISLGRKAAFYFRGPSHTGIPLQGESAYLVINCIGIGTRNTFGDQGSFHLHGGDESVYAYNNTIVSLTEIGAQFRSACWTISGGGGGPVGGKTQYVVSKNNLCYQVDASFVMTHYTGINQNLREYKTASDGNCWFGRLGGPNQNPGEIFQQPSSAGGDLTLSEFQALTGADANSISADPLFNDVKFDFSGAQAWTNVSDWDESDDENLRDVTLQAGSPCHGGGQLYDADVVASPDDYPAKAEEFLKQWASDGTVTNAFDGFDMLTGVEQRAYRDRVLTEHTRDYNGITRGAFGGPSQRPSIGAYE